LLAGVLGTPWATRFDGAILFVEDVDEPVYRIDRMLTHLGLSGNLAHIAGMVVGHLEGDGLPEKAPEGDPADWPAIIADSLERFSWPLAWGLESGHRAPNRTLPLGLPARLDGARGADGGLVLGEEG